MLMKNLFEERKGDIEYNEKRVKGELTKVTAVLKGKKSEAITKLGKRYKELDDMAKKMQEERNELNVNVKAIVEDLFDAQDQVATRIVETVSFVVQLSAVVKAEDKKPKVNVDYQRILEDVINLFPDLTTKIEELKAQYTTLEAATDTPTRLTTKNIEEGVMDVLKGWISSFKKFIRSFYTSMRTFDTKLAELQAEAALMESTK